MKGFSFFCLEDRIEVTQTNTKYGEVMHGSILPVSIPPGQPRGQVQPFDLGGGELFEAVLSRGEGGGENRK